MKLLTCCLLLWSPYLVNGIEHSKQRVFNLTEENPSFAIHGGRLQALGVITINGCDGCDFLIDYSHRDCKFLPDPEKKGNKSSGADDGNNLFLCLDSPPFSINGRPPRPKDCNLMPYSTYFESLLYYCSYELLSTRKLTVGSTDDSWAPSYAISFRIRKWVNETRKVLVVPGSNNTECTEQILAREGYIVTFVANPAVYRNHPYGPLIAITADVHAWSDECEFYEPELNCGLHVTFPYFFGSDPGLMMDGKTMQLNNLGSKWLYARTTAVTIMSSEPCAYCIEYTSGIDEVASLYFESQLDTPSILTSYNYPWPLDDPTEYPDCQDFSPNFFPPAVPKSERKVSIEVLSLTNGVLNILTGTPAPIDLGLCYNPNFTQNFSMTVDSPKTMELQIQCLRIRFCPDLPIKAPFGFMLFLSKAPANRSEVDCQRTFTITREKPQVIFHALGLSKVENLKPSICIVNDCGDSKDCRIVADLSVLCPPEEVRGCSNQSTLQINGRTVTGGTWKIRSDARGELALLSTQLIFGDFVYLRVDNQDYFRGASAFSFRSLESTTNEADFLLFPNSECAGANYYSAPYIVVGQMHFWIEESPKPTWISFASPTQQTLLLEKFRWDRATKNCEYRLVSGIPDWSGIDTERDALVFRDEDPFISQLIRLNVYSILVPPGCTPGFSLVSMQWFQNLDQLSDVTLLTQEVCDGAVVVMSPGYGNVDQFPDHLTIYNFTHRIICNSFPVDLFIEVESIGNGILKMDLLGDPVTTLAPTKFRDDSADSPPYTKNATNVQGISIYWRLIGSTLKPEGCFVRVHVKKSRESPTSQVVKETTKT